ncbi:MAG: sigma-54-dependent Fis family transcriptional regulator [Deltaproteobacteria bacterium]|nr:sigma-54-dependent Fis family transcriptional regulator [Deltaproteobacteria bacterium]
MSTPLSSTAIPSVLLVDDESTFRTSITRALDALGSDLIITPAENATQALALAAKLRPEVVVLDLTLDQEAGPAGGLALLESLLALDASLRVLVLTGARARDYGVTALRIGAASFLEKPVDASHLLALIEDGARCARIHRSHIERNGGPTSAPVGLICDPSGPMSNVIEQLHFASSTAQPVLLAGETGTGKGVLAHAIHTLSSNGGAPFIRFQPTFGTFDLALSELFGHERGAFTGASAERRGLLEDAHRGTLFIDEVDELSTHIQIALLHTLQERRFRRVGSNKERHSEFRLITATNRPLPQLLSESRLREDFFHRIAHCIITIPPLRERKGDIRILANEFLRVIATREKFQVQGFTPGAEAAMLQYQWPGNVRELQGVVEGAVFRARFEGARYVDERHFTFRHARASGSHLPATFRERVRQFELDTIEESLRRHAGNQALAAKALGLDRSTLRRILARGGQSAADLRVLHPSASPRFNRSERPR